jgi:hypothetical protein
MKGNDRGCRVKNVWYFWGFCLSCYFCIFDIIIFDSCRGHLIIVKLAFKFFSPSKDRRHVSYYYAALISQVDWSETALVEGWGYYLSRNH